MCGKKGEERTSSIANAVCMDNYIIIIILLLLDIIGSPGSAIMQAKKKKEWAIMVTAHLMHFQSWKITCMSMRLKYN